MGPLRRRPSGRHIRQGEHGLSTAFLQSLRTGSFTYRRRRRLLKSLVEILHRIGDSLFAKFSSAPSDCETKACLETPSSCILQSREAFAARTSRVCDRVREGEAALSRLARGISEFGNRAPSSMRHVAYVRDRRIHRRARGRVDPGRGSAAARISRLRQRRAGDDRRRSTGRTEASRPGAGRSKSCSSASRRRAPAGSATRDGRLTARPPTAMPIRTWEGASGRPRLPWCTTA